MQGYTYTKGEHYPVEHLVFKVAPEDVEHYLAVDHEIWTLKEAYAPGFDHIPFLYKEVWVNDNKPGEIHFIFVWESIESWRRSLTRSSAGLTSSSAACRMRRTSAFTV